MKDTKTYEFNTTVLHLTIDISWSVVRLFFVTIATLGLVALIAEPYRFTLFGVIALVFSGGVAYCFLPSDKVHTKQKAQKSKVRKSSKRQTTNTNTEVLEVEDGPNIKMVQAPTQGPVPSSVVDNPTDAESAVTDYGQAYEDISSLEDII